MGYDPNRFLEWWSREFICPLCRGVYEDPVMAKCLHQFCRGCLARRITVSPTCPLDGCCIINVRHTRPIPVMTRRALDRLHLYCDFRRFGCTVVVELRHVANHRADCPHRPHPGTSV